MIKTAPFHVAQEPDARMLISTKAAYYPMGTSGVVSFLMKNHSFQPTQRKQLVQFHGSQ